MFGSQLGKWVHWVFGVAMGICFAHLILLWQDPEGEWLSFLGDVTGAAIGAGAAVIVALVTLDHQKRADLAKKRDEREFGIKEAVKPLTSLIAAIRFVEQAQEAKELVTAYNEAEHHANAIGMMLQQTGLITDVDLRRIFQEVWELWQKQIADLDFVRFGSTIVDGTFAPLDAPARLRVVREFAEAGRNNYREMRREHM